MYDLFARAPKNVGGDSMSWTPIRGEQYEMVWYDEAAPLPEAFREERHHIHSAADIVPVKPKPDWQKMLDNFDWSLNRSRRLTHMIVGRWMDAEENDGDDAA